MNEYAFWSLDQVLGFNKDISLDLTMKIQHAADFDPEGNFQCKIWKQ